MSGIMHDTLHVWHIDLSYSYKQKTTRFCVAFTYFHIFSCILAAFFNTPLLRYFAFDLYLFCDCPALSACGMVFKLSSQYDWRRFQVLFLSSTLLAERCTSQTDCCRHHFGHGKCNPGIVKSYKRERIEQRHKPKELAHHRQHYALHRFAYGLEEHRKREREHRRDETRAYYTKCGRADFKRFLVPCEYADKRPWENSKHITPSSINTADMISVSFIMRTSRL